jgi:hypothetical protein
MPRARPRTPLDLRIHRAECVAGGRPTAAPSFAVDVSPINMRDATDIERGIAAFARSPNGGSLFWPAV